ncbi:unnamed protein product [Calypogeia fissa]
MAENGMSHKEEEGEEHEEGEISDEEPPPHSSDSEEQVESSSRVEVDEAVEPVEAAATAPHPTVASPEPSPEQDPTPVLRKRVGLDESIEVGNSGSDLRTTAYGDQNRKRDSYAAGRRDLDTPNEDDGGNSRKRNDWGAYGSNLYNFAWAQAVSGRPSFSPSAGDSPTISPTSKVTSDGLSSSGSGSLGSWLSVENIKNLSREYSRDLDSYGRSLGRSSEERDDMSPLRENGSRTLDRVLSERDATSRGRRIIRETSWSGRTERFVTVKSRIEKNEKRGGLTEDDYHRGHSDGEDARRRKQRSDSGSPNGRLDEVEEARGRSPSEASVQVGQNGEENGGHEDREEGELEEGEIELPVDFMPGQKSTSPPKEVPNPNRQQNKYSGVKAGDYWAKDKNYARSLSTKSQSRSQVEEFSSRRHRQTKPQDSHREKRLALAGDLVKNVTVKDAQKSFVEVCNRLHKSLRILDEVHTPPSRQAGLQDGRLESISREIGALTRQAFAGIRAVYAVRNTASGREQERDKNIFPRLLELANGYCQKLFTPKQTRELEVMMQTIANAGRLVRDGGAEKGQYPREHQFQPVSNKKSNENDSNATNSVGETVGSSKPPASTEAKSSSQSSIAGRILGIVDAKQAEEAAAIAAAALAYAQSSAAARANSSFGSIYNNRSSGTSLAGIPPWGFLAESPSQVQFNNPGVNPLQPNSSVYNLPAAKYQPWNGAEQRSLKLGQDGFGGPFTVETKANDGPPPPGPSLLHVQKEDLNLLSGYPKPASNVGTIEDEWEALSPPGSGISSYPQLPIQTLSGKKEPAQSKVWPSRSEMSVVLPYQKDRGTAPSYPPELLLNLNQQRNRTHVDMYSTERLPSPTPRLPSPTPDEEDDDPVAPAPVAPAMPPLQSKPISLDVSSKEATILTQPQGVGKMLSSMLLPGSVHNLMRSPSLDGPGSALESRLQKGTSGDLSLLSGTRPMDHSESVKTLNSVPTSLPPTGIFRSRDPRRRFQNNSLDFSDKVGMDQLSSQVISAQNLTLGEAHLAGLDGSKKRVGLDFDDKQDLRMQKRLKGQPDNVDVNGFASDSLHAASGTGGWLDDNVVPSFTPMEELPNAMEVEEGPSTTVEGRIGLGMDAKTGETGQRKMKPRDPRRAFLGTYVEKGDSSGGDTLNADGMVAVDPRTGEVGPVVRATTEVPSRKDKEMIQAPKQGANLAPHFMEKMTTVPGIPPVIASEQLVSSESVKGVSGPVTDGGVGDDSLDVEDISVPSESCSQEFPEPQKDKSTTAIVAPRKSKGSPSQWGASQVHPHLEQLLGDLSEEDRRSVQLERQRRMEEQDRMFSAGKLCLVLDLDHTLLNSAKFSEIEPEWDQRLRAAETAERNRTARDGVERRELYRFPHMSMWTKLRPGIWKFLARASQLYELHVYTMGNKVYATEMAKLLDPTGKLFAGRVISKGDDGDGDDLLPKSKDLDGVLGMESAVVIIDDSARVWPHHSQNLIVVERYMYFPCSRRQFGLAGPSLLEVGHDERESDGMLASALGVIDRIHGNFFKNPRLREVDVREILAAQQRQVLAGCKVVFSRVFPVGEAEPHRHPLWRTAEQFGAICSLGLDEQVTHVVAISLGTDKVNWALETGRYVVRPAWLEASTILYRRANERDFPVLPQ